MIKQEAISNKKLMVVDENGPGGVSPVGACETRRNNCLIISSAAAIAGHIACASVDIVTVGIGALICHGAVALANSAANSNCILDYDDCVTKQLNT